MREMLRNFFTNEKAKMKGMTFKEKAAYIWEYYKIPIIGAVVFLAIVGSIVNSVWIHPAKKPYLEICYYAGYVDNDVLAAACGKLENALMTPEEMQTMAINGSIFMTGSTDPQMDMAYQQKFAAMISTQELDLLVINASDLDMWAKQGILAPIKDSLSAGLAQKVSGDLLEAANDTGEKADYAVKIDGNKFFKDNGLPEQGMCLGVIVNTKRADNVKRAVEYILNS